MFLYNVGTRQHTNKSTTCDAESNVRVADVHELQIHVTTTPSMNTNTSASDTQCGAQLSPQPLDEVCLRYWSCHKHIGMCFAEYTHWDMDGIVVTACSFAREILQNVDIDYTEISVRVAICACYTISWKKNTDDNFYDGLGQHSFLTACYSTMYLNMFRLNSSIERDQHMLHNFIEHMEGQIVTRIWTRIFAYSLLNPACRMTSIIDMALPEVGETASKLLVVIFRKVAGFVNMLVQVCESYDHELTRMFNDVENKPNKTEEALLLLCTYAAVQAGVLLPDDVLARAKKHDTHDHQEVYSATSFFG